MSIKLIISDNTKLYNQHYLLDGLDVANQHPIEAIIGLRKELDQRYIKPSDGIPASDLADTYISIDDLYNLDNKTQSMYATCQQNIKTNKNLIDTNTNDIKNNKDSIFNINSKLSTVEGKITSLPDVTNFYGSSCIAQKTITISDDKKTEDIIIIDTDLKVIQPTIIKSDNSLAKQGIDYFVSYPDDITLRIEFTTNGVYKINYISGEITDSQYDVLYNAIKKIDKQYSLYNNGSVVSPAHNVSIEYDGQNRIIKETYTGNINKIINYEYDANDNIIKKIVQQDDAIKTANYKYDSNNSLVSVVDDGTDIPIDGTKSKSYKLDILYDNNGYIVEEEYTGEINKIIKYQNNVYGDIINKTVIEDGVEKTATYIYDQNRKLINIIDNGTEQVAIVFKCNDNNSSSTSSSTSTVENDYITNEDIELIFNTIFKE